MEERSWLLLVLRGADGSARITVLRQSGGGKELAIAGPQRCCWECQDHCIEAIRWRKGAAIAGPQRCCWECQDHCIEAIRWRKGAGYCWSSEVLLGVSGSLY